MVAEVVAGDRSDASVRQLRFDGLPTAGNEHAGNTLIGFRRRRDQTSDIVCRPWVIYYVRT
ncbi:hypothetical protein L838_0435 [Mycobacterium avium MAV_120709_2344]|nr:hypothetical protein L842_2972 [Mycobacterium intracellulare MIN_052511_1280]ETZ57042.1 hypothetical protein L838_0435 [Mycobacterium avium MAV_120709_2344]